MAAIISNITDIITAPTGMERLRLEGVNRGTSSDE